ncbi:hypothetical protein [Streptomyces sp. NRRL S-237]|uniref:hypothetical protein n=1 Tax=Streptomyces sp. NRRL S-237 TaxID=1463895 RepID=UPI0004C49238
MTGGSRGIGRAVALRLAADGALVGVHHGGDEAAAGKTPARTEAAGGRACAVPARFGGGGHRAAFAGGHAVSAGQAGG